MRLLPWILSALLALALAGVVYMFVIRGNVEDADDGRTAILLDPAASGRHHDQLRRMPRQLQDRP